MPSLALERVDSNIKVPSPLTWQLLRYVYKYIHRSRATEPIAAAKRARRQTKAREETLLMGTYNFNLDVMGQAKVRSNTKNWICRSMDFDRLGISRHKDAVAYL